MPKSNTKYILILLLFFSLSLLLRWNYIGTLAEGHHQFSTAQLKIYVENWFYEGIFQNNFLSIWIPKSINYEDLEIRIPYISYPIGTQFIIFIIKQIFSNIETLKIIHFSSATTHYLIALLIFLFIDRINFFNVDNNIKKKFALISAISYIFFPSPFYYHLMLFNYDTVIILPFISILFLEYLIREKNEKKYLIFQSIILFISAFLDYLTVILSLSLFIFRIIKPLKNLNFFNNLFQIFFPLFFPFMIQLFQLFTNDLLYKLFDRFINRSGIADFMDNNLNIKNESFIIEFWIKKLHIYLPLTILSIIFLYKNLSKKNNQSNNAFLVILIGFIASISYNLILQDYASNHDFAALKFYPLLSITLFSLIPLKILEIKQIFISKIELRYKILKFISAKKIFFITMLCLVTIIFADNTLRYIWLSKQIDPYFNVQDKKIYKSFLFTQFSDKIITDNKLLQTIFNESNYNDVYLSMTDFYIERNPPEKLSLSRKIIKKINSTEQLEKEIKLLPNEAILKIIIYKNNNCLSFFNKSLQLNVDNYIILKSNKNNLDILNKCVN